ncbi:MAG TPA: MFS transporter [Amaricoccus sp.]|uniref:MFS transporter n=1 Tax=Amaricoccus sp. TaxID=1872485 RepID=UPI002C490E5E|nr:MFS transporter [Amaricoccus sp.]HMQ95412.1 MFS transporter [Amaricoccus sp.]HMR52065.1 MFS transporter [Amaricoccus sp.]HMR61850.1 MFS transporter [Amaricoccus sp.]HMT98867.1 MFS transporter [Amaricoccus sp.]
MSVAAPHIDPDIRARRNLRVLVAAQVILGSQMPVSFILGGLAGQMLSPIGCLATLPISLIVFGSMLSAPILSNLMQKRGRTAGFLVGAAGGALGGALCAWALIVGSFALFLAGSALSGLYMSAQGFYRFAATDGASEGYRPKAISWVMAAGLASAIVGPQMVKLTADALAPIPFAGAYLAVVALNLLGAGVFWFLDSPRPAPPAADGPRARSHWDLMRDPRIGVAMLCGMVSYALMNLVMTSTPLAIVGCGYGTADAANVVSAHVLAMFAPSFFTGNLIARFGAERIIATGLVILACAGLVGLAGVELTNFFVALVLLGLGWNFGFIGATAMLTGAHRPEERGRVQGMNDFAVFGLVGLASLASGGLMNCIGGDAVAGWKAVNLAMIPMLALAGSALIWLVLSRRRTV